jgi:hypothetical protein
MAKGKFRVDDFGTQYSGDYARSNLFHVTIQGTEPSIEVEMLCKTASLPAATVGVVEVPYQNRKMKVPGDRTFADWTATIMNDQAYVVRSLLLQWQRKMVGFLDFKSIDTVGGSHRSIQIQPMKRNGKDTDHSVTVYGWPSEIGAIDLSWETADTIQEYTVTFAISWDDGYDTMTGEEGKVAPLKTN